MAACLILGECGNARAGANCIALNGLPLPLHKTASMRIPRGKNKKPGFPGLIVTDAWSDPSLQTCVFTTLPVDTALLEEP